MEISVIIVNYNVRQFLENALFSLKRAMEGLAGEIIVVDNASDDGSVEMLKEKFPDVVLIRNKRNVGFARANNIALQRARGRYFLLINPDTVVQEDTIRVMVSFFDENDDVGLAGCKILNPDGSFQLPCRRSFPTPWVSFTKTVGLSALFPRSRLFGRYNLTYLSPDETYPVDAVSGSFMMFSRRTYEQVGGLDETFFMYGEDLDYCYRVQKTGFKVFYVHGTKIIHFKGESTKRSDINEISVFHEAMRIFVKKHFGHSFLLRLFLSLGITLRAATAFLGRLGRPLSVALLDFMLTFCAMLLGEMLRYGALFRFPEYAYPIVWIVPPAMVVSALFFSGVYTTNRYSVSRSGAAVIISYVVLSAVVFFAKDFAFSRIVVAMAGVISVLVIPGWRLLFRFAGTGGAYGSSRKSLFGRRTVIVGTGPSAQAVLKKLRGRVADGYEILGFVSTNRRQIGERIAGLEVIGSIDNVGRVISDRRVSEVIFSTEGLSFTDILSVIGRSSSRSVNFRLVPNSLEAIIGKASIDELDAIPLVEIEYNIHRPTNRLVKRLFDILLAMVLVVTVYPWKLLSWTLGGKKREPEARPSWISLLPQILLGKLSFVGLPYDESREASRVPGVGLNGQASYLGPRGLTGLVQLHEHEKLDAEETEKFKLYYAKNQSLILDIEILLKTMLGRK